MKTMSNSSSLELDVTNFGPIANASIDLRPLTVFVGPSNTGKSYLAILIYALHKFFGPGVLGVGYGRRFVRRSPLFQRSWWDDLDISEQDLRSVIDWGRHLASELEKSRSNRVIDTQMPESVAAMMRPAFSHMSGLAVDLSEEIRRCFGVDETKQLVRRSGRKGATVTLRRRVSVGKQDQKPFEYEFFAPFKRGAKPRLAALIPDDTPLKIELGRDRPMFSLPRFARLARGMTLFEDENEDREVLKAAMMDIWRLVFPYTIGDVYRTAHYLPADRTGVMHAHRLLVRSLIEEAPNALLQQSHVAQAPVLSGVMADFLAQLLEFDDTSSKTRNRELVRRLEENVLTGTVSAKKTDISYPRFFYTPKGWKEELPLMNTSSMVSELAPVILYLRHIVVRGDLLIIEEPESHLHPAMQAEFARQLALVVKAGIRVIVTTHSEWILDQFANLVRLSALPESKRIGLEGTDAALRPEQFGAWLFQHHQRPKGSVVEEIRIDPEAGGLLSDYSEVAEQLYNTWAEIENRITESKGAKSG